MPIPLCCSLFRNSRDFGLHSPLSSIIMRIERPWLVWLRAYFPLDPESRMQSAVKTYSAERSITCTTIYGIVQQKRKKRGRFLIKKFITGNSKTVHSSKYHIQPSKVPNVSPKSFEAPLGGGSSPTSFILLLFTKARSRLARLWWRRAVAPLRLRLRTPPIGQAAPQRRASLSAPRARRPPAKPPGACRRSEARGGGRRHTPTEPLSRLPDRPTAPCAVVVAIKGRRIKVWETNE